MKPPPNSSFVKRTNEAREELPRKIVFGSPNKLVIEPQPPRKPKQISEDTIKKILVLEEFFHNKALTLEATNELVGAYVEGVEHFDRLEPSMRYYYLEKIQFVLSRPEVINVLSGTEPNKTRDTLVNLRDTLRGTTISAQPVMINPVFANTEKYEKDMHKDYNEEQKKKERSIKAQMYVDVQEQIKEQAPQLRAQYVRLEKAEQDVIRMINNQHTDIEKRREQRRLKKKKRNSFDKLKIEEIQEAQPQIQLVDLQEMQREVHDQIIRFTIRQTSRQNAINNPPNNPPIEHKFEPPTEERPEIRETSRGGRIKIKADEDDD